jgi:UDP-N-acetylmuramoylalanine--D-glutamate ligase
MVVKHQTPSYLESLAGQPVAVLGLGLSGRAAAELLAGAGARVWAFDEADTEALRASVAPLAALGVTVHLGQSSLPPQSYACVVTSPGLPPTKGLLAAALQRGLPCLGELELGFRACTFPNVSISGTNGKTTTTELMELVLRAVGQATVAAGNIGLPLCAVATQELDRIVLEISSFQLETIHRFRPHLAILLNLTPDHFDRYPGMREYLLAKARLFENQTPDDWAIVQQEALVQLQSLQVPLAARLLTFSATAPQADIYLEGTRILSRRPEFPGLLLDQRDTRLRGPHNAENLMAVLAASQVLGLPMETVRSALCGYRPAPHRCEWVAEIAGVQYVNDSKATNVDAVEKALRTVPPGFLGSNNVWLIAGGKDKGFGFDELIPWLRQRVKMACLIGETQSRLMQAWGDHVSCAPCGTLSEAVLRASRQAAPGDVVLLSPACSSFDQFRSYQHRGEVFKNLVEDLKSTTDSGCTSGKTQHNEPASIDGGHN